jgi:hypothetical protein
MDVHFAPRLCNSKTAYAECLRDFPYNYAKEDALKETPMDDSFIHRGNIKRFKLQILEATGTREKTLLRLLAIEEGNLRAFEAAR